MAYAETTSVSVEKTRAEIETLISKSGATHFAYMTTPEAAIIGFRFADRQLKFVVPLPSRTDKKFTTRMVRGYQKQNDINAAYKLWEQACRSRWRALLLCLKAKLEAVQVGITTIDQEFLAHIVTENGLTIGQRLLPQLGNLPSGPLLLGN